MGFVDTSDVRKLLQDPELRADIAKAAAEDAGVLDDLADDIADQLEDELESDAELKKQIIDAAMSNPDFKKKLIKELLDDLG
jgi:hypothetical protein